LSKRVENALGIKENMEQGIRENNTSRTSIIMYQGWLAMPQAHRTTRYNQDKISQFKTRIEYVKSLIMENLGKYVLNHGLQINPCL